MTFRDMSSAELAGQAILLRFPGPDLTRVTREAMTRIRPAGVILFGDNISSRTQIHATIRDLQAEAEALGLPPLLIGIDQEGGMVSRLNADPAFVTLTGAMALAATGRPDDARRAAGITGRQLRQMGINIDFAPVVDVNNNHDNPVIRTRSFGDSPDTVSEYATAQIHGLQDANVAATVKHFPGHGDTSVDSHIGLPVIPHGLERLRTIELAPFQAAIEAGVAGVMTTHILFPELDTHPATLSPRILTGILREKMGFEGVIFTDSMSMKAIHDRYGTAEAAVQAVAAGVDILEANDSLAEQEVRHTALMEAMRSSRIPRETVIRSAERSDALRRRFDIGYDVPDLPVVDPAWQQDAVTIAAHGIASFGESLPTLGMGTLIVDLQRLRSSEAEDPVGRGPLMRRLVERYLPDADIVTIGHDPKPEETERAASLASRSKAIVFLTRDATDTPYQFEIAGRCLKRATPHAAIVHIALRSPYDLGHIPARHRLATFGDPAVTLEALVRILAGTSEISGSNPLRTWSPAAP